ncbi:hypothetical protein [Polaribacter sp.]|uniref:hypothetical protein n=1 Tax=Polaribacter sp. TaxID=1920175 RepID=UPI003F6CBBAF
MNLPINSLHFILLISTFTILLIVILYLDYKKTKILETNRLNYLLLAFNKEKLISNQLQKMPEELKSIEQNTLQKFQKIKVGILNINFSLSEIFNSK